MIILYNCTIDLIVVINSNTATAIPFCFRRRGIAGSVQLMLSLDFVKIINKIHKTYCIFRKFC